MTHSLPLSGRQTKDFPTPLHDPNAVVGGMVDIWKSMHKVLGHKVIGPRIAAAIDAFFADHFMP